MRARGRGRKSPSTENPSKWNWAARWIIGLAAIEIECPAAEKFAGRRELESAGQAQYPRPDARAARAGQPAAAFDWNEKIPAADKLETVNLTPFFNDKVTQIFRNEYRSPRSPFASLATPKQGLGGWCEPNAGFDVDDSGLRALAAKNGGEPSFCPTAFPGHARRDRREEHHFHVAMGQLSARSLRAAGRKILARLSADGRLDRRDAKPS